MLGLGLCNDVFFFQAEDGIRDLVRSRGLGDVYKRQVLLHKGLEGNILSRLGIQYEHDPRTNQVRNVFIPVSYTHLTLPTIYSV